ncbi:MAG: RNA polymerase sigma-70 factor [Bacteroidetes bacterium]|nr:RNA polymerase sigma-70 factor [Bacteroidota bacterium]
MRFEKALYAMGKEHNNKLDRPDFEWLFGQYYKPLCAAAFVYLRDRKDAEDVVQQLFVRLWERRSTLDAMQSAPAYLFTAVRNACLNHLRRLPYATMPLPADLEETARLAMDVMLDEEKQRVLMSALDILNERNRRAFELVYFENKTYRETAMAMDVSVNTVKWHLKTALSSLRNHPGIKDYFLKK